jgi:hypothetical protein
LQPQRRKNAKRKRALGQECLAKPIRQRMETTFSLVTLRFPRHIHTVTARGFAHKPMGFLLVFAGDCL